MPPDKETPAEEKLRLQRRVDELLSENECLRRQLHPEPVCDTCGKIAMECDCDDFTLPGEQLIVVLIEFATKAREQMPPALRDRLDAVTVQQIEDMQALWRGLWIKLGVVKA